MKFKDNTYELPQIEIVPVEAYQTIAASNLENPEDGGEWDWN